MTISVILYITLALLIALGFAFFQYLYRRKNLARKDYLFFGLRTLAVFLVLLILINPKITSVEYELEKPELIILADNSQSISHLDQNQNISNISKNLAENAKIKEIFQVNSFQFGEQIDITDSLDFTANQSNIYNALSESEKIFSEKRSAIVMLTDGNQNLGRDYKYFKSSQNTSVFPVILGDTTTHTDLSIERINSNRYAFLNNRFPVEAFLNYTGNENITATVRIKNNGTVVHTEKIQFSKDNRSQILRTDLPANSVGVKTYSLEIDFLENEKNKINNLQDFAVEVIDEQTSVLIVSDISHPDLGALQKSIESNQQRSVDIKYLNEVKSQLSNYQLVILYQVNNKFNSLFTEVLDKKINYLVVTGSQTDWNYLSNLKLGISKNSVNQPQEFFPVYNETFGSFQFEDIGFNDFPPLIDKFGSMEFEETKFHVMLFQEIEGVETEDPLIAVSQNSPKSGFILGENIWRWRAKSYLDHKSFQKFDDFLGKLIQNLAKNSPRQRLTIDSENLYYSNENVVISAQYLDENYQFDAGASLKITMKNEVRDTSFTSDMILKNNFYQFGAVDLPSGEYSYNVKVSGRNLAKSGNFKVVDFSTEQQFITANLSDMKTFAENNGSALYYEDQMEQLVNALVSSDKFKPVQKSQQKRLPLIDWYYLLFILVIVLAAEWFYRKYVGLI
ncbi:VWA domain-containing protein [Christiangramia sp.]|uniref:VWA domain-containing protein n=1 Tax=Christiangramia sp. TaxID=1931228 RepID=UPI002611D62F|nr:VWA domain-containing protein [Christiangramia sp.]